MNKEESERLVRIEMGVKQLIGDTADQEGRLRSLEKSRWFLGGAIAIVAATRKQILDYFGVG